MAPLKFTNLDKFKLIGLCIKAVTGVIGGSMIIAEGHPYWTIAVLSLGAGANEIVNYIKDKENKVSEVAEAPINP